MTLKRLQQETQELTGTDDLADQKSMLQAMLEQLQCPEEDTEQPSAPTFTINACADEGSAIEADTTCVRPNTGLPTTGHGLPARHLQLPTEAETVLKSPPILSVSTFRISAQSIL